MATVILEHSDIARSNRLAAVLRDYGHRLEILRVHRGDPVPTDLDGVDALICCGGAVAPDDDTPEWIEPEMALVRAVNDEARPLLGICFGSQLLARALGGTVARMEGGIECGWNEIALTPAGREDPLFAGQPWRFRQPCWHRYHVEEAPPGARILAGNDRSSVQAWGLGLRTYGVQYHPEAYVETVESWADDEPEALAEAGLTRETLRRQHAEHAETGARLARRFFEALALVVMPVDRRYAGIAKDMHH